MASNPLSADERFYQRGLTGLRALAALWVMMFHLNAMAGPKAIYFLGIPVHPLMTVGWVGVNIFFVLSGFLLTTHLMQSAARRGSEGALRSYLAARVRRVFPAYWAQLLVLVMVTAAVAGAWPAWSKYLPLHVPMLHHLSEKASFAINPVYWTLPIEFSFYLCLPFFVKLLLAVERRGSGRWAALAGLYALTFAAAIGWRYAMFRVFSGSPPETLIWAMSQLPGTLDEFIAGSGAAVSLRWLAMEGRYPSQAAASRASSLLGVAGLAGIVAMMYGLDAVYERYWSGHWLLFSWYSITCVFIVMLVVGIALGGPLMRWLFENRIAFFLGTVSYSIYLWHFPLGHALTQVLDMSGMGIARFSAISVPVIVAVSALSYWWVERPFMKPSRDVAAARLHRA